MRTIKLTLSYDGTNYVGWQSQDNGISIQQVLKEAIHKMTGEDFSVAGAGRTDAGVHALGQVASFKTQTNIPRDGFKNGLNSILPRDIRIVDAVEEKDDFDARRDASAKHYRYSVLICAEGSALMQNRYWRVKHMPDLKSIKKAAKLLVGEYDFASFCAAGSLVKTTVRNLRKIRISKGRGALDFLPHESTVLNFNFYGEGFLRHMVRNIVGMLMDVGYGKIPVSDVSKILRSKDRKKAGVCAPACGLYLVQVFY